MQILVLFLKLFSFNHAIRQSRIFWGKEFCKQACVCVHASECLVWALSSNEGWLRYGRCQRLMWLWWLTSISHLPTSWQFHFLVISSTRAQLHGFHSLPRPESQTPSGRRLDVLKVKAHDKVTLPTQHQTVTKPPQAEESLPFSCPLFQPQEHRGI